MVIDCCLGPLSYDDGIKSLLPLLEKLFLPHRALRTIGDHGGLWSNEIMGYVAHDTCNALGYSSSCLISILFHQPLHILHTKTTIILSDQTYHFISDTHMREKAMTNERRRESPLERDSVPGEAPYRTGREAYSESDSNSINGRKGDRPA